MGLTKSRIIKFALLLVFLICMLFANFYAVRKIMRYGLEMYFYDKLLVAYNIGGTRGMELELEKMRSTDKMPRELTLAKGFEIQLKSIKDPEEFLSKKVAQNKKAVDSIRSLRNVAIMLMALIFGCRLLANFARRFNRGENLK